VRVGRERDKHQGGGPAPDRVRRYRSGLAAERLAELALRLRGYRILARRYRTSAGEIDLITVRRRRIGFVEVKARASLADCQAAITPRGRQRVRRAAALWLAREPAFQGHDLGFDIVFVVPRRWPVLLRDGL